jgi:hypothetical protein
MDLSSCVFTERFDQQVERLKKIPYSALVIEGTATHYKHYLQCDGRREIAPIHKLYAMLLSQGVPIFFASCRAEACDFTEFALFHYFKKYLKTLPKDHELNLAYTKDGKLRQKFLKTLQNPAIL